jgi:hypothetical protein
VPIRKAIAEKKPAGREIGLQIRYRIVRICGVVYTPAEKGMRKLCEMSSLV